MGCDIHIRFEVKKDGVWTYNPYEMKHFRNYDIFAILAGVRGPGPKITKQGLRGLPQDIDPKTLIDEGNNGDYDPVSAENWYNWQHSITWYTLAEILKYFDVSDETWGKKVRLQKERIEEIEELGLDWFDDAIKQAVTDLVGHTGSAKDVRMIFGFDS